MALCATVGAKGFSGGCKTRLACPCNVGYWQKLTFSQRALSRELTEASCTDEHLLLPTA